MPASAIKQLVIRQPDDWHVHLRDDAMLNAVVKYTARQFARAIVMPNLSTPCYHRSCIASAYKTRILNSLKLDESANHSLHSINDVLLNR